MLEKVGKSNTPFLNAEIVKANKNVITITNSFVPEIRKTNFGDKLHIPVRCGSDEYTWTCNNTTMDALIDELGQDESKWQGKTVNLEIMPTQTADGMRKAIYTKKYVDSQ
jgi:hypothetical protein